MEFPPIAEPQTPVDTVSTGGQGPLPGAEPACGPPPRSDDPTRQTCERSTRTYNTRFRSLRRLDFATPEETTKSTVSRCRSMTWGSISSFAAFVSFTVQRREKVADLRNPQINICHPSVLLPSNAIGSPSEGLISDSLGHVVHPALDARRCLAVHETRQRASRCWRSIRVS